MKKLTVLSLILISLFAAAALLPGCTSSASSPAAASPSSITPSIQPTLSPNQLLVTTQFGRMLGKVPYSFLAQHDVWFGNPKAAKDLHGIEDVNSLEDLMNLPPEESKRVSDALSGVAGTFRVANWQRIQPVTGFDVRATDRIVFTDMPMPWTFSFNEGNFDSELIKSKLIELGYQKVDYGSGAYYAINDDFSPGHLTSPVSQLVLSAMNRVAVLDRTVITAPATDIMTGILDVLDGKQLSVVDSPDCRVLALSMGDVLSGVIMNPERTLNMNPPQEMPPFNFSVPADWGLLHQYGMTGIGYRDDGKDRYLVISLYYENSADAQYDAGTLVTRMKSYILNTRLDQSPGQSFKNWPLTDKFEVGQAKIYQYPWGAAALTIESKYKPETGSNYWSIPVAETRDLLFLAPDPTPYIKK